MRGDAPPLIRVCIRNQKVTTKHGLVYYTSIPTDNNCSSKECEIEVLNCESSKKKNFKEI